MNTVAMLGWKTVVYAQHSSHPLLYSHFTVLALPHTLKLVAPTVLLGAMRICILESV